MDRYPALERVRHAELHTVLDPEARVLLTPLPQGPATPLLDLLARAAGIESATLDTVAAPTSAGALHDPAIWPAQYRWASLDEARRREITEAADWLRLTITADPAARVWDAWQAVVLLRTEDAEARFGEEPWFPGEINEVPEMLAAFRSFVHALGEGDLLFQEPRWTPQTLLLEEMPTPTHVFAADQLTDATALLAERLNLPATDLRQIHDAVIPYHPGVYDAAAAAVLNRISAPDFEAWDHQPLQETDVDLPTAWQDLATALLPVARDIRERNLRHAELHRRWQTAENQLDLERGRIQQLRDRLDQRWDERSTDRAAIVALTARADSAEADLARVQRQVVELRARADRPRGWQRTKQRARQAARRTRDRMRNRREDA